MQDDDKTGSVALALVCMTGLACHAQGEPRTQSFADSYPRDVAWPTAEGWRSEEMKFPLGFAKTLRYEGVEEIRFMPGFFDANAPGYWSYAFAWVLSPGDPLGQPELESDLVTYFRGLCHEVGEGKFTFDDGRFKASLNPVGDGLGGTVATYDPFGKGQPLMLNVRVRQSTCPGANAERIVLFSITPRPDDDATRTALEGAVDAFRCQGPPLF